MNENSSYIISPLMQGFNIDYCFMKITVMRLSLFIFIIVILFVQLTWNIHINGSKDKDYFSKVVTELWNISVY